MADVKFTIKDFLMNKIGKQIDAQTDKGVQKYGQSLDACAFDEYDWLEMANQELIDLAQYQQKEIRKLNKDKRKLEARLEAAAL